MRNTKVISIFIFLGVIVFALLDSNSSLNEEASGLKREIGSRLSNTNKMASFISKMPALTGAIEFQSFNQLDVVIDNMFKEDATIKSFLVLDQNGSVLHSKTSKVGDIIGWSKEILANTPKFTYHFLGENVFISKRITSELNQETYFILFQINYFSLLNDRLRFLTLPAQSLGDLTYHTNNPNLDFIGIDNHHLQTSYLVTYLERNVFRLCAIVLILILLSTLLVKLLISPVRKIITSLQNITNDNSDALSTYSYPRIFRPIVKNIIDANLTIMEASKRQIEADILRERNIAVAKTAEKVAHDIRSPLTSLEFIVKNVGQNLAEKERIIANQALERISDILRTLGGKKTSEDQFDHRVEIIDPLVKRILSEKRLEFKTNNNIEMRLFNEIKYGTFVQISKADFYRTMSNLINNSAEAAYPGQKVLIDITLSSHEGECLVTIKDNGKGIPKDALSRVFQHGVSYEKKTGSGIGLTSAKETIEKYRGSLTLHSEERKGTIVTIKLPIVPAPRWFKTSLNITTSKACIIDDDDSIHSVWDEILSDKNLSVIHIKSSDEFEEWIKGVSKSSYSFLFDLELLGSKLNGLELIEKFNLEALSTLVTSHYDDQLVQDKAQKLGVKIIPKDSASYITINSDSKPTQKMVLIDDDNLTHLLWELGADKKQVDLATYFTIDDFLKDSALFAKDTAIYIDSNFKDGIKGEIESKKIFELGFKNLNLASGMDFPQLPYWIKGNQGKAFPLH